MQNQKIAVSLYYKTKNMVEIKIKVESLTEKCLSETGILRLQKARALYASQPFVTKTWMAMKGFPMEWLKNNWDAISC